MSEEEILEYSNMMKEYQKQCTITVCYKRNGKEKLINCGDMWQGLLNLYIKEKENNELLIKRFRHLIKSKIIARYDEKKNGKYILNINEFDNTYISKDKIRERIKQLEEEKQDNSDYGTIQAIILDLENLLEE